MTGIMGNDRKPGVEATVLQQGYCGWELRDKIHPQNHLKSTSNIPLNTPQIHP